MIFKIISFEEKYSRLGPRNIRSNRYGLMSYMNYVNSWNPLLVQVVRQPIINESMEMLGHYLVISYFSSKNSKFIVRAGRSLPLPIFPSICHNIASYRLIFIPLLSRAWYCLHNRQFANFNTASLATISRRPSSRDHNSTRGSVSITTVYSFTFSLIQCKVATVQQSWKLNCSSSLFG